SPSAGGRQTYTRDPGRLRLARTSAEARRGSAARARYFSRDYALRAGFSKTSTPKFQPPTPKCISSWELDLGSWELGADSARVIARAASTLPPSTCERRTP